MYSIAVVEDDKDLNNLICAYLKKEDYKITSYHNGVSALEDSNKEYDLWLLDIMLGDSVSGHDIIIEIKKHNKNTPVIFISARNLELDRITGLELGSDDYITKPFSPKEMVLRIRKVIERVYRDETITKNLIEYEDYKIDKLKRAVYKGKELLNLTAKEIDLLLLFLANRNQAFSREQILSKIWGSDYFGSDRVVDDLVRRLRNKMPKLNIETIYSYGYRFL